MTITGQVDLANETKGRGSRGKRSAWLSEGGGEFKVPDSTVVRGEKERSSKPILILEGF